MNKKLRLGMVLFILSFEIEAQNNLVPNNSFESYVSCPTGTFGEINKAIPWFQPNYPYAGAGGSSDFDHFCAGYNCNSFKQCPRTGLGMAGISFFTYPTLYDTDDWREYLEVKLTDTLKFNKKYCIKFHVNLSNNSCYPIKQIQAKLTNDSLLYSSPNYSYITGILPSIESSTVVSDTVNWIPVKGVVVANGTEKFLTIGNFSPGDSVSYIDICGSLSGSSLPGYYFIDDVSVYELPDYNAGVDTTICPWHTTIIGPQNVRSDVQYSWSPSAGLDNPNIANPTASPLVNMTYVLTVTDTCQWACNSTLTDTINIAVTGCVGVEEFEIENLKLEVYPNPANEKIVIETNFLNSNLKVVNLLGKAIIIQRITQAKTEIKTENLPNGIYYLQYFGRIQKLIIQR